MDKINEFLNKFRYFESVLRRYYKIGDSENELKKAFQQFENDFFNGNSYDFDLLRQMRNHYSHTSSQNYLFDVSDKALLKLDDFIKLLNINLCALDIATKNIIYATDDLSIKDLIRIMDESSHSFLPILNDKKVVTGLFSNQILIKLLHQKENHFDDSLLLQSELLKKMCRLDNYENIHFVFVACNMEVSKLLDIFNDEINKGNHKYPVMMFVTKNGRSDEALMGLITPWDLLGEDLTLE